MLNWTPQQWAMFFMALASAIVLVLNALTGNAIGVPSP